MKSVNSIILLAALVAGAAGTAALLRRFQNRKQSPAENDNRPIYKSELNPYALQTPDCLEDSATYTIPVEWEVYDCLKVKALSLEDAVLYARSILEEIPLGENPAYRDDSYRIIGDEGPGRTYETVCNIREYEGSNLIEPQS